MIDQEFNELYQYTIKYQELVSKRYGISDIGEENGWKMGLFLQRLNEAGHQLTATKQRKRGANDILNIVTGRKHEAKFATFPKKTHEFASGRELSLKTINRFKTDDWYFAMFFKHYLLSAHYVEVQYLTPLFNHWIKKYELINDNDKTDSNPTPRISTKMIIEFGECLYTDPLLDTRIWQPYVEIQKDRVLRGEAKQIYDETKVLWTNNSLTNTSPLDIPLQPQQKT
jgi:hypothetical protein